VLNSNPESRVTTSDTNNSVSFNSVTKESAVQMEEAVKVVDNVAAAATASQKEESLGSL
jgi:hypothetical protein